MTYLVGHLPDGPEHASDVGDDEERAAWEAAERSDQAIDQTWAVWQVTYGHVDLIIIAHQGALFYHVDKR